MNKKIIGYATNTGIQMMTKEDAQSLTHINLAFGLVDGHNLSLKGLTILPELERIRQFNPAIQIVLSIGGWGAGGFSNMAMTKEGRKAFAASCKEAMDLHHLDGVDIDWEYPCNDSAGIDADPRDKENFTLLLQELRSAAGSRIVSIAAGAGEYFVRDTQMDEVSAICDYVQLMTYDMRSGFTHEAGHHAALDASKGDLHGMTTKRTVDLFAKAGVPLEKIIIGAAFYSRIWRGVPGTNQGLLQIAQSVGEYGPDFSELYANYINKNGWTRHYDAEAKASFLRNEQDLISYEDAEAIALKCEYVKEAGLGGIMYWEHSCDTTRTLLRSIVKHLKNA